MKKTWFVAATRTLCPVSIGKFHVWVLLLAVTWTLSAAGQINTPFETGCGALPFQDIALEHKGVDDYCGIGGVASASDVANQQQNRIKNNFCLKSSPVNLKTTDFITLQKKVDALNDFTYGSGRSVPEDRSPLDKILSVGQMKVGEGTLITVVGYMMDPHYSDVRNGEGVNCKRGGNERNDIHFSVSKQWIDIDYTDRKGAQNQLCNLITGEVSPHFRPDAWEVDHLSKLVRIPVRLTGQLFFDASHVPCRPGKPVNPPRVAVWEIHPIYAIDVCKSKVLSKCRANVDSDWVTMDNWAAAQHENEVGATEEP